MSISVRSRAFAALLLLHYGVSAQPAAAESVGTTANPLIYGADTREQARFHPDPLLRALADRSSVALIPKSRLEIRDGAVTFRAPSLAQDLELCGPERFDDEPVLAECSGVLVDDDLVLTAAHCVDDAEDCNGLALVFGYATDSAGEVRLDPARVYSCAEIVARELSNIALPIVFDYALLRLDHPVGPDASPARVRSEPIAPGEPLVLVGNGLGLPSKIDSDGRGIAPRSAQFDYFSAQLDLFHRGSGSGIFDVSGGLIGIAVRGGSDFESAENCRHLRSISLPTGSTEEASYAAAALSQSGYAHLLEPGSAPAAATARAEHARGGCALGAGQRSGTASALLLCVALAARLSLLRTRFQQRTRRG